MAQIRWRPPLGGNMPLLGEPLRRLLHQDASVWAIYSSDMKGLMQILGLAGPSATYPCMLCYARLNQTFVAGVSHLADLPEPWRSKDMRAVEVVKPPPREGTKEMAEYARQYAETQAAEGAPQNLSSAAFMSCTYPPMIEDDDLSEHLSRTPLHITLAGWVPTT